MSAPCPRPPGPRGPQAVPVLVSTPGCRGRAAHRPVLPCCPPVPVGWGRQGPCPFCEQVPVNIGSVTRGSPRDAQRGLLPGSKDAGGWRTAVLGRVGRGAAGRLPDGTPLPGGIAGSFTHVFRKAQRPWGRSMPCPRKSRHRGLDPLAVRGATRPAGTRVPGVALGCPEPVVGRAAAAPAGRAVGSADSQSSEKCARATRWLTRAHARVHVPSHVGAHGACGLRGGRSRGSAAR